MGLFRRKEKSRKEPVNELLVSLRSIWEQDTFNNALKKYYQGRYFRSDESIYDIVGTRKKFEAIIAYYEPYVIWQKMKPFRKEHHEKWINFCDKKNIDYNSFKERDFFYELLCKKYNKTIYATDDIPYFDDEIECDIEFLGGLFNGYIWSRDTDKINEFKEILNSFKIVDDELEGLYKDIDNKVVLRNLIIETVKQSEGVIKQSDLKNLIDNVSTSEISQACSSLEKFDVIRREKSGSSYTLTVL